MSNTKNIISRMLGFVIVIVIITSVFFKPLKLAFFANPAINGLIIGVLLVGTVYVFRQVFILNPEIKWIKSYKKNSSLLSEQKSPRMLAPMATMLGDNNFKKNLSTLSMRTLLDGISSRLDESREISRYVTGLLIFLGLLGTFLGLLETINSIGNTISTLKIEGENFTNQFNMLKSGLEAPLKGMGTAFSSSLFGLSGSLILGFLDLQAGQAQNRFYNELEEWLSKRTQLTSSNTFNEAEQSVPVYVQALLEQTVENLDNLRRTVASAEGSRQNSDKVILKLQDSLATLTEQTKTEQDLMVRLIESQIDMKPILERISETENSITLKNLQSHLKNIEKFSSQLVQTTTKGQEQMLYDLRNEFKLLAKTLAASMTNIRKKD
ncbi:MAG: flagellar motor protein MotA [Rhodospirillaceae bacterium]|nr:flagellar motor protein MotA [Rhodospirillaceae bacterium]